ncbi:MAG: GAF domain-containing protein [candidate division Zixibacteria bacterium]|nr:GAF domain-containing protein [candidate division Zixibacteria bacterium]
MESQRLELIDTVRTAATEADSEAVLLRTVIELIDGFSDGYNWTGFYMMQGSHLEVGPYIGEETEHVKIELNRGICGAAASQKTTVTVDDVQSDSRFIACSLSTRSEIVVPLMDGDTVLGEIDIDSDQPAFFTDQDKLMLEEIAALVVDRLRRIRSL